MTGNIALSTLDYLGTLQKRAKRWRFRKPNHLHGWRYGFAFRLIAGLLATASGIVLMFVLGAFTGWKITNGILIAGGIVICLMIYIAEHLRSRVYERVVALAADKRHIDLETPEISLLFRKNKLRDGVNSEQFFNLSDLIARSLDICLSFGGLVLMAPLFVVIGALIKFDSGGPIFSRQMAKSEDGNEFLLYRFRTHDRNHRLTSVGRFLVKTSLDQIPILFNILDGTIALPDRPWRVIRALSANVFKLFRG